MFFSKPTAQTLGQRFNDFNFRIIQQPSRALLSMMEPLNGPQKLQITVTVRNDVNKIIELLTIDLTIE